MRIVVLVLFVLSSLFLTADSDGVTGYPWRSHQAPYDFTFGNHIDVHQQSLMADGDKLQGFLYIRFMGGEQDGVPIAEHGKCDMEAVDCTVGWVMQGLKASATFKEHVSGDHPTWCVDASDLPKQPGYVHFHWLNGPAHPDGSSHDAGTTHEGGLESGETYDGYLLKLTAVDRFFFKHHGGFLVEPGIDYETHANIEVDCP